MFSGKVTSMRLWVLSFIQEFTTFRSDMWL